jgi:hypothetical protein
MAKNKRFAVPSVRFMCGSWGVSDNDITHDVIPVSSFPFGLPRVGETVSTKKAHYHIVEIGHELESNCVNVWFDDSKSDIYD